MPGICIVQAVWGDSKADSEFWGRLSGPHSTTGRSLEGKDQGYRVGRAGSFQNGGQDVMGCSALGPQNFVAALTPIHL